jgi:hypothetical protein
VSRKVESSPLAGDDASRHPTAAAVVHVRMVRIAPDARTCARANKLSHQHARVNRYEGATASIIAADLDHHAESLDAVAGSEFVDDRIRLRE